MKRLQALILSALWLICIQAWPGYAEAGVCLKKTAIVFGNGMFNDRRDAKTSLGVLEVELTSPSYSTPFLAEFEFYLAYADNGGAAGPLSFAGIRQLHQVFVQAAKASESMFWRWLGGAAVAPVWFSTMMNNAAKAVNAAAYVNNISLQQQLKGNPANIKQQPGYRALLNQGMRVVIVAHSQGNFYANAAYDALTTQKPVWASSIGIVAVATPDSRVADGRNRFITVPEDAVIGAVRVVNPLILPANPPLGVSPNMLALGIGAWKKATYGHDFVGWYLAGSFTRNQMMIHILNTRNALKPAPPHMVAQVIMKGSSVAPAPDGSIYITTAGGVRRLMPDGKVFAVPGVPRVEHVGPDGSLYYAVKHSFAPASIFRVMPSGLKTIVVANRVRTSFSDSVYDVASDGSVYFGEGSKLYRIDTMGTITHVAGRALYSTWGGVLNSFSALGWGVNYLALVKAGFNGQFYFGDGTGAFSGGLGRSRLT